MTVPQGTFSLERHPPPGNRPLRAWDAADEYLLHDLADLHADLDGSRVLTLNDGFGALTVGLTAQLGAAPLFGTDSHVSTVAARANLERNGLRHVPIVVAGPDLSYGGATGSGSEAVAGPVDVVVARLPRSLGLLDAQLHAVRRVLHPGSRVVAGSMSRHLERGAVERIERILGPVSVSLDRRKARLVHCTPDLAMEVPAPEGPATYQLPGGATVVNHPGVHAAGRLDPGTRLLLDHLPVTPAVRVLDLGCGDGALGLAYALRHPDAAVLGIDESHAAVLSGRATFAHNGLGERGSFAVADVLGGLGDGLAPEATFDLVLVNPPFHAGRVTGDDTAWAMFVEARRVLRPGGELRVVGNRHLAHHAKLRRLFGNATVIASNPKFVVCSALCR